jgi:hypothetical protein
MRAISATARYWLPLLAGFMCFVAVSWVSPLVAWLLIFAGFGLTFDGATAMFARAGRTGGLTSHRQ